MINTEEIKEKLLLEKQELLDEISTLGVSDSSKPGGYTAKETTSDPLDVPDEVDLASEMENFSNNEAILKELEQRLESVDEALVRIETGVYGKCKVCGKDIEEDRIMANLAASTCKEHMDD